jgi:hypothetical protein
MDATGALRDARDLEAWLDAQPAGQARIIFTDDTLAAGALLAERLRGRGTMIAMSLPASSLAELQQRAIEALADAASELWPFGYGRAFSDTGALDDLDPRL